MMYISLALIGGCTTLPQTQVGFSTKINTADERTIHAGKSVWIDTDAACSGKRLLLDPDDCWAILYALKSRNLNVRGISSVRGNSSSATALKSIQDVISNVNAESEFLVDLTPLKGADEKYVKSTEQEPNEAVRALAHMLESERLTIIAIGPLTNIAALLDWRPELASNIDRIVAVAGQRQSGLLRPKGSLFGFKDLNVRKDMDAFQRVLDAELAMTLLPFEIAQKMTLERPDLKRLAHNSAGARWIATRSRLWDFAWRLTTKVNGFHPYDLLAVAFIADPTQFHCEAASGELVSKESTPKKRELIMQTSKMGRIEYCTNLEKNLKPNVLEILSRRENL